MTNKDTNVYKEAERILRTRTPKLFTELSRLDPSNEDDYSLYVGAITIYLASKATKNKGD